MNWLIIIVLIVLILVFLRMKHMKQKVVVGVIIMVILFFYLTAPKILAGHDVDLKSAGGIEKAVKIYFSWFGQAFSNMRTITANAVKMDWGKNSTAKKI